MLEQSSEVQYIYIVDPYNKVYFWFVVAYALFSSVMIIEEIGVLH